MINLKFNYPSIEAEGVVIQQLLSSIDYQSLLGFPTYQGDYELGEIARHELGIPTNSVIVQCNSGNHSLSCVLQALNRDHSKIVTEPFTYPAFKFIAMNAGFNLYPATFDQEGLTLEGLQAVHERENPSLIYLQPTIHNPTCAVMSTERRKSIANFAREHGMLIIEDDAYRFLHPDPPPRFIDIVPENTVHIFSLAKPFNSLLKTAFIFLPEPLKNPVTEAVRLNSSGASSLLTRLVKEIFIQDKLGKIIEEKRSIARERQNKISNLLSAHVYETYPTSFHIWLKLPEGKASTILMKQLERVNIQVPSGTEFSVNDLQKGESHMRIALGAEKDLSKLEEAIYHLRNFLIKN